LPGGMAHPEFQDKVVDQMTAWLREHPPSF
jgi:hypothetical protein